MKLAMPSIPLFILLLLLAGCGGKKETHSAKSAPAAAPVPVQVITAATAEAPAVYETTGTVRAKTTGVVSAKVMGYVREVKVSTGDQVQAGQLLIEIDARDLESQVRQAEAASQEARNAEQEVNNAVASAKANLELAQVTFKRMEDLFQKKSISNQEYDEASARLKVARAGYEMAVSKQQQLRAKIRQAEEAVKAARIMLGYARITAPFAGTVVEKRVEPGNLAAPGVPLLVIEQSGGYRFEAAVEESKKTQIRVGSPVTVHLEAIQKTVPARVSEVVPAGDPQSRTFTVKIDLPSLPMLHSGMFGRAVFPLGARRQVLAVPADAVIEQGQVTSVIVAEGGAARHRLVTVGSRQGGKVEILSGLTPGEKVVYPRPANLADGAPLEVRP
jgi:RND family efflux transporter MFP subunit